MTRLDRYLVFQLMSLFGFFALVLVSVYWVNRAVRLFDSLIADGQTALVVLEFTALTLPYVIRVVLPVAAFAATVYAINRLDQDSELVVMRATGASNWRLARPVAVFGLIVSVMMAVLVHFLVPLASARLAERQQEVRQNVTARFLSEGSFQHPGSGVTLYVRRISELGVLEDLFLSDSRSASATTTYSAEKALIVRSDEGPRLVMFDGMAQSLRAADGRLSVTRFGNFTYDIVALLAGTATHKRSWEQIATPELLAPSPGVLAETGSDPDMAFAVLQRRLAQPLLAPVSALIGFAALMMGTFSRFGLWRQMGLAIVGLIVVQSLTNAVENAAYAAPDRWALFYLPAAVGMVLAAGMLWLSQRPRRICGRAGPGPVQAEAGR